MYENCFKASYTLDMRIVTSADGSAVTSIGSFPGASFTKKDRTISLKMLVRSFLRSAYVGFTKTS